MSVNIQVAVEQGLTAAIQGLIEDYPEAVGAALMRVAERVLETSNVLVPVRTGFLKSSMGVRQDSNFQVTFYAQAPYAVYVEFGTSRMSARLFMTRSLQQHQEEFPQEVEGALVQLRDAYFG
jgi:HK97 gp10 family phage protein